MAKRDIISKLNLIFSAKDVDRFKINDSNNTIAIILDVHGYSCREARRVINSLISICRGAFILKIIHGYNHGTAIKEMLWKDHFNPRFANIRSVKGNPGMSVIDVCSGY